MNISEDIMNWRGKQKERVLNLTEKIKEDRELFSQLVDLLKTGSDVEKGTCAIYDVCTGANSVNNSFLVKEYLDMGNPYNLIC